VFAGEAIPTTGWDAHALIEPDRCGSIDARHAPIATKFQSASDISSLAHGSGSAEQAYACLRVKFSHAVADHHGPVVYSDLRMHQRAIRAIEPA
jgi:hypothetical protein